MTFEEPALLNFLSARSAMRRAFIGAAGFCVAMGISGCQSISPIGHALFGHTTPELPSQYGSVAADEPRAAIIGRDVLLAGGNAADAATAMALTLSVTLPSRASLGGGGACLVSRPGQAPKAVIFAPLAGGGKGATRPAAVPMMLRGIYRLQRDDGHIQFEDLMIPAIRLAERGINISPLLASDLQAVHEALFADEAARQIFMREADKPLKAGDRLVQPRLARFLERTRRLGVGDFYNGALGTFFQTEADLAGGGVTRAAMRNALPSVSAPIKWRHNGDVVWLLPPPADGGLGAASALRGVGPAQSAIAAWRNSASQHGDTMTAQAWLEQTKNVSGSLPALPASTSFTVMDRSGGAVACSLTNNNLFGTGRVAPLTGIVLARSPDSVPQPLLSAAIMTRHHNAFAALASSGQNDAADALAVAVKSVNSRGGLLQNTGQGRVNLSQCDGDACSAQTDPQGHGLALGNYSKGTP